MVFQGSQSSDFRGITGFGDDGGLRLLLLDDDAAATFPADLPDFKPVRALGTLRDAPDDALDGGLRSTNRRFSLSGSGLDDSSLRNKSESSPSSASSTSSGRPAAALAIMRAADMPPGDDERSLTGADL